MAESFCNTLLDPFLKEIVRIKFNLVNGMIFMDDRKIKALECIIQMYNELNESSNQIDQDKEKEKEKKYTLDDFINSDSDDDIIFDEIIKKYENDKKEDEPIIFNQSVINMVHHNKSIFDYYKQNDVIYCTDVLNSDDSDLLLDFDN